jgi:hypothetical protein
VKFNFCNGKKKQHREREMRIGNLPAEVNAQLNKLRSSLGYSEDQLFKVLNVPRDIQNSHSCLRTKWLFEYYSIYGTLGWVPGRSVPNYKIKQKLSAEESSSCRDLLL